jgi:hypothetical protein
VVRFTGKLTPTPSRGGGTLVPVPAKVARELGLKGMPKVKAMIGGMPYRGSLMSMGDGTYCLGVLKSIQAQAGVGQGDSIVIELELDTEQRIVTVPQDLQKELARDRNAAAAWEAMSYTNRKEIARSLEEAKKSETRERRLAVALERLRA